MDIEGATPMMVGEWEVHPRLARMSRGDEVVRLSPKFIHVLVVLAHAGGDVVTRNELLDTVWPDTVVGEAVLTRAVSELRKAFRDESGHEVIETIPTIGYRLLLPVNLDLESVESSTAQDLPDLPDPPVSSASLPRTSVMIGLGVIAVVVLGYIFFMFPLPETVVAPGGFRQIPVTSLSGEEFDPAFAPNGELIVFARIEELNGVSDIFVMRLDGSEAVPLTRTDQSESSPTFSPDSRFVAFIRCDPVSGQAGLFTIPVAGGGAGRQTAAQQITVLERSDCEHPAGLSWSPDGSGITFSEYDSAADFTAIYSVDLNGGGRRNVSGPPSGFHDADVRFSPDGRRIAFTRSATASGMSKQLLVQNSDGGGTRVLSDGSLDLEGIDWSLNGQRIVVASRGTLIEIDAVTGERSFIAAPGFDIVQPAVSRIDGRILFVQSLFDVNIWKMTVPGSVTDSNSSAVPSLLIASTRVDNDPRFSPDGNRIAYISDRSGECGLYISDLNGSNAFPVATFDTNCWNVRDPRWSPDGLNLAFDIDENARRDVYVVSTAGGPIRRITEEGSDDFAPGWSADGKYLYVTSDRSKSLSLWRINISPDGVPPTSYGDGRGGTESHDGLWVYYSIPGTDGLWRQPVDGGKPTLVVEDLASGDYRNWRLVENGLLYVRSGESRALVRHDITTGETTVLSLMPEEVQGFLRADIAPTGFAALFSHVDQDEDDLVMLVPITK